MLDTVGSSSLLRKLGLVPEILRPLTIEIGLIERRESCLLDVAKSFGRIWAFSNMKRAKEGAKYSCLPEFLSDLRTRWEWRVHLYTDINLLDLSHLLDPSVRLKGINSEVITQRVVFGYLTMYFDQRFTVKYKTLIWH